ncbi:nucleoside deoxyribosyltransferase [Gordonia phage TinaLin]|uniref:Nucleoside deoxyribosyltransferase n=1 Tax=Gordonia phage TinaLin TaxID=2797324 RepID=A0A7T7GTG6_9CAUD|nr:nucleoside deoxyribosyltransferase [Gordonia phage TinaLin]QQM15157.1 nucleoside deoxyribosyltransferase [Gordonia phage TinaLin]
MSDGPKLVVIESPFAGDRERNLKYARAALLDSLKRGEAPIASHLLYPQVLDDDMRAERIQGMAAGFAWNRHADLVAVYCDLGMSGGMRAGLDMAERNGTPVEYRDLKGAGPW